MSRNVYRVKFKLKNGRDGGFGDVQSYKTNAGNPQSAVQKMRKKGARVISVRLIKKQ